MSQELRDFEQRQVAKLAAERPQVAFRPGDTLRVRFRVVESGRERIQAFQGVCIARNNGGINSSFTVRKISFGEGVERVFPLYSPRIEGIDLIRPGKVRRAKLHYLRGRRGKSARITENLKRRAELREAAKQAARQQEQQAEDS